MVAQGRLKTSLLSSWVYIARLFSFLMVLGLGAYSMTAFATVDVRVDRNPVQEDESFTIRFSSDNGAQPDFSPLQRDFKILQTNQSRNMEFSNGALKQSVSWGLLLSPLHAGTIIIPSIAFGNDKSPELQLEVKPATSAGAGLGNQLFFIQVDSDTHSTYVQGQVLVTLKLYLGAANIMNLQLDKFEVNDKDASIHKLGNDADYNKRVGNKNYRVIEKRFAVFPQTPGTLTIPAMKLEVRYVADRMALSYKQVSSKPIDIEVKPIPSQFKGNYWLPASSLRLQEDWNPPLDKLREGEPATRTITLVADGSLSNLLPPIAASDIDFAKQYPDQPALSDDTSKDGVIAKRVEKIAIIPDKSGSFSLPAIKIPWWNTKKQRMEIASLKSRQLTVHAGKGVKSANSAKAETAASVAPNQNQPLQQPVADAPGPLARVSDKTWFYVSLVLAALWLATLAAWIKSSQRPAADRERSSARRSKREQIEKAIEKAVDRGDLQAIKQLLIQWSQSVWGKQAPRSIGAMIRYSNSALADELDYLNKLLYANETPQHWDGQGLCAALKAYKVSDQERADEGLRPLYQGNL